MIYQLSTLKTVTLISIFRKGPKFLSSDVTDGMAELDISGSGHTFSKVEIEPRNPKLNMELQYKGIYNPAIVFKLS